MKTLTKLLRGARLKWLKYLAWGTIVVNIAIAASAAVDATAAAAVEAVRRPVKAAQAS